MTPAPYTSDERIIKAVKRAIKAGDTDPGGGVHYSQLANHCRLAEDTLKNRCKQLADNGKIKQVWGIGATGPRMSYLPVESDEKDKTETPKEREWIA